MCLSGPIMLAMVDSTMDPPPAADDPRWARDYLRDCGLVESLPHREGLAWVKFRFLVPSQMALGEPALLVTQPADAERAYLNGVPIGGEGDVGDYFTTYPSTPRLYPLPPGALRPGVNELLMKVLLAGRNVRVFDGPILLGEQEHLEVRMERQQRVVLVTESAFLTMLFYVLVFYGFLIAQGLIRSDYLLFLLFTTIYMCGFFLRSYLYHVSGVDLAWGSHIELVLSSAMVPLMLALVTSITGGKYGTAFRIFFVGGVFLTLLDVVLPPLTSLTSLAIPRKAYLTLVGLYYILSAGRALARRRPDAWPTMIGVTVYVIGSRIELFLGLNFSEYALGVFALCMLYSLTSRHARLKNRLVDISSRLLDAHEEERRRIARDIHDSIGQALLALKMRAQMIISKMTEGQPASRERLEGLVQDASAVIEDVRRASMDLRPSFIESMSLVDAIRWYVEAFSKRQALEVRVLLGDEVIPDPPPRIKDNLYRIFQELLTNAAKHSGAIHANVSLYRSGKMLVLQVADDGKGLPAGGDDAAGGIGLATMRERAELLSGTSLIESAPGRGTVITVEVPLP